MIGWMSSFFNIHCKNIQSLGIEYFQVSKKIANLILHDIIPQRSFDYNLKYQIDFVTHFGLNSSQYFASEVWKIFPPEHQNISGAEIFKLVNGKWEPT